MKKQYTSILAALAVISAKAIPFTNTLTANAISKWEMESGYTEYRHSVSGDYGLTYYIYPDHAALVEVDWDWSGVILPETVEGVPLTTIADGAFYGESTLYISIPSTVTDIGTSLGELERPFTLVIDPANESYVNVDDVIYTADMTELVRCCPGYKQEEMSIPDTVKKIDEQAFYKCEKIKTINIPASVEEVGLWSFGDCSSLEAINVDFNNERFSSIDGVLFNEDQSTLYQYPPNKSNISYTIPNSVDWMMRQAFQNCDNLESVKLPKFFREISYRCFAECDKLNNIVIPEWVEEIDSSAFQNCSSLTDITFSENTKKYASEVFDGTPWYENEPEGAIYTGAVLYKIKGNLPPNTEFVVKEGTKGIAEYAFCTEGLNTYGFYTSGDSNLVKVVLPDGIEYIGQCAFHNCINLTEINLPESLYQISNSVFAGCEKLNNVTLPESLAIIDLTLFSGCSSIEEITVPEYAERIEWGAFEGCESLKRITILRPECEIEDAPETICNTCDYDENFNTTTSFTGTIYGYENSTAQKYAEKYGYKFESLGKSYIKGDCNDDGAVNIADAVMLQKFLLGDGSLAEWKNADLCEDERIDVFDMIVMRRLIVYRMDPWHIYSGTSD